MTLWFCSYLFCFFQGDEDIMDDQLSAENKEKDAFETFMRERLNSATKDVFSSITQLKLKTFKQRKLKTICKLNALKASRTMIIHIHLAARVMNISLRVILQHNLTNVPLSIADQDGSLAHMHWQIKTKCKI